MGHALAVSGKKRALSGKDKVEEIVVAGCGAIGVKGRAAFPSVLVEGHINVTFIWKDIKNQI